MNLDPTPFAALLAFAPPADGQQGNWLISILPFVAVFGIFYFLIIAPTRKQQKRHQELIAGLKNGDQVVTSGGIRGTVVGLADDYVQVRVADQVKIEVMRSHVADVRKND